MLHWSALVLMTAELTKIKENLRKCMHFILVDRQQEVHWVFVNANKKLLTSQNSNEYLGKIERNMLVNTRMLQDFRKRLLQSPLDSSIPALSRQVSKWIEKKFNDKKSNSPILSTGCVGLSRADYITMKPKNTFTHTTQSIHVHSNLSPFTP